MLRVQKKTFRLGTDPVNRRSVRAALFGMIDNLPQDETCVVKVMQDSRSLRQNSYIWGVVYPTIASFFREHWGEDYSNDAIHEILKQKFLPFKVESLRSGEVTIYRSTTELTKREFFDYTEHIIRWAAEFNCIIPEPDFNWRIQKAVKEQAEDNESKLSTDAGDVE